jgi:orotate phosphoribosyltransferase
MTHADKLAETALQIGAIQFNTDNPFTWASGYRMPIYNDNRLLLGNADHRLAIAQGFQSLLEDKKIEVDAVAGTATAGIPPATTLADLIQTPLIYVRSAPKKHGRQNQIEGVLLKGQNIVVVEDLVSTGGSVLNAIEPIRLAGGKVQHCFCIFTYGFQKAREQFENSDCQLHSLLTFEQLIQFGKKTGALTEPQTALFRSWFKDPFQWGEQHGFPQKKE